MIEVVNRQRLIEIDRKRISELANAVLARVTPGSGFQVTLALVRDHSIRQLNRRFRGKDLITDVLSFPNAEQHAAPPGFNKPVSAQGGLVEDYLGDIVISTDAATRQARAARHSVGREISELVIHGVLHLLGYDHEVDDGEMNRLELSLRRRLLDRRRG